MVVIRCAESEMLLTQPFLVKKSLVPLLAATQIMFSEVQKPDIKIGFHSVRYLLLTEYAPAAFGTVSCRNFIKKIKL